MIWVIGFNFFINYFYYIGIFNFFIRFWCFLVNIYIIKIISIDDVYDVISKVFYFCSIYSNFRLFRFWCYRKDNLVVINF